MSDENTTRSVKTRWKYTNDIIAGVILISFPIVMVFKGMGKMPGHGGELIVAYATVYLMAATWAFGKGAIKAVRKIK
jgi:hypothetical protein